MFRRAVILTSFVYRRVGGLEVKRELATDWLRVYRRVGGLEVPQDPGQAGKDVYRRVGGLEERPSTHK